MYLGIDLGTSSLKAVLINDEQDIVCDATAKLSVNRPFDGWSEQSPVDWIHAATLIFDELATKVDLSIIKAIGLSGQMHGATLLDREDKVLWPCILWNDVRASDQATRMDSRPEWRQITGNIVFPGFTAPKVDWMRESHPQIFDKIKSVLLPKDYLRLWLTGEKVSDMSDAAGTSWFETGVRDWSDKLLQAAGLSRNVMPRLVEGTEVSGTLRPALATQWGFANAIPVAGGAGDNAASAVGMGVLNEGEAFLSLGTSGVLFVAREDYQPNPDSAVHTFCHAVPDKWHQMGVILAATDSMNWWAGVTGRTVAELIAELEPGSVSSPGRTIFLPFLGGERTPWNSATVRGGFVNLDHSTNRQECTRAVIEGVAFALADCRDALAAAGTTIETCFAIGGGSVSTNWLLTIATALGVSLDVPVSGDVGAAFGAARLGMIAHTGKTEMATSPPIQHQIEPVDTRRGEFIDAHGRYRQAVRHLLEIS